MDTQTVPATTADVEIWLEWMADQPSTADAIDAAIATGAHFRLLAYLLGLWETTARRLDLEARISARFEAANKCAGR